MELAVGDIVAVSRAIDHDNSDTLLILNLKKYKKVFTTDWYPRNEDDLKGYEHELESIIFYTDIFR